MTIDLGRTSDTDRVISFAAGGNFSVFLMKNTRKNITYVLTTGYENIQHQLDVPDDVQGRTVAVGAAYSMGLAVLDNGKVAAWGTNDPQAYKNLLNPSIIENENLDGIVDVFCSTSNAFFLREDKTAIGVGITPHGSGVIPDDLNHDIKKLSLTPNHTMLLRTDGTFSCWGINTNQEQSIPEDLIGVPIIDVADSVGSCGVVTQAGEVRVWGSNKYNQANVPDEAKEGVIRLEAGDDFYIALKESGQLISWGGFRSEFSSSVDLPVIEHRVLDISVKKGNCVAYAPAPRP